MKSLLSLVFILLMSGLSTATASCPPAPAPGFSSQSQKFVESTSYALIGNLHSRCIYFRDATFKNGQGQQAVVIASKHGHCLGLFRTALAKSARLMKSQLEIKSVNGNIFTADISRSIPREIHFDGEIVELEKCLK